MTEEQIIDRHEYWCKRIEQYIEPLVSKPLRPLYEIDISAWNWCGAYFPKEHTCIYAWPYAVVAGPEYDDTIAHEVCHAYQRQILAKCKWHGEVWQMLMEKVCNKDPQRGHEYDKQLAKKARQFLRTLKALQEVA